MEWVAVSFSTMDMSLTKLREMVKDGGDWCAAVLGVAKNWTQLSNRTTMMASTWEAPDRVYAADPKKSRIEFLPLRSTVWSGRQSHK